MQRVHTLAKRCTEIEASGRGLQSALFARCTYTLIRRLKSPSLNSPSICENESCTELEEEMLNKYMCRPCVPLNFDGTPVCMLKWDVLALGENA